MSLKYPDGPLGQDDEGALNFGVYTQDGRVIMDFGKDLSWLGFDADSALALGEVLIKRANDLRSKMG